MFGLATKDDVEELRKQIDNHLGNHCTRIERAITIAKYNSALIGFILTAIIATAILVYVK